MKHHVLTLLLAGLLAPPAPVAVSAPAGPGVAVPAGPGPLVVLVAPVVAAEPEPRDQALHELGDDRSAEARRHGAQSLGDLGTMADVPRLVAALRDRDPIVRGFAEQSLWQVWSRSGDEETDLLLQLGIEQMSMRQGDLAVATFTRVIQRRPDFAEGWNKRATVYYLLGEFQKSLADCDEVLKRNPYHFGALSGYGLIYLQLDQPARALEYFERALAVNPNLEQVQETAAQLRRLLIERRKDTI